MVVYAKLWWGGSHKNSHSVDELKKPSQVKNTMKLDAIREDIDRLHLDEVTSTILFCLIVQDGVQPQKNCMK